MTIPSDHAEDYIRLILEYVANDKALLQYISQETGLTSKEVTIFLEDVSVSCSDVIIP